jgi:hypothetical protein
MKDWFSHLDFYKTRKCDLDRSRNSRRRVQRTKLPKRLNPAVILAIFSKNAGGEFRKPLKKTGLRLTLRGISPHC